MHLSWSNKLIVMLGIKLGANLEVKLGVGSKTVRHFFCIGLPKMHIQFLIGPAESIRGLASIRIDLSLTALN